jgi:hypothetical protein
MPTARSPQRRQSQYDRENVRRAIEEISTRNLSTSLPCSRWQIAPTIRKVRLRFAEPFKGKFKSYQFNGSKIAVTDTGRSVPGGKADHITLNGIDRWIGGVHLLGHWVRWRWDERIRKIVSQRKRAAN